MRVKPWDLGLLLLMGVLVWLLLPPGGDDTTEAPLAPKPPAEPPEAPAEPTLRGAADAPAVQAEADEDATGAAPRGPGTVEVLVTNERDRPLEGAHVRLKLVQPRLQIGEGKSDAEGRIVFRNTPTGRVKAYASLAHHEAQSKEHVATEQTGTIELTLRSWPKLSGRVVAARDGRPVASAQVVLTRGGCHAGRTILATGPPVAEVRADEDGRFRIPFRPGKTLTLAASAPGYAQTSIYLNRKAPGDEVVLRLPPGGSLSGLVRRADGAPVPDAAVFVVPSDDPVLVESPRSVVGPGGARTWGSDGAICTSNVDQEGEIRRALRTRSDAEGRYEIHGLGLPVTYRVLAEATDGARGGSAPVALSEAGPRATADVVLQSVYVLVVRLEGIGGGAYAGEASLSLEGPMEGFLEPRVKGGGYEMYTQGEPVRIPGLPRGRYDLRAWLKGSAPLKQAVEVGTETGQEVVLRAEEGVALEGLVARPDGTPVADVEVAFRADDDSGIFGTRNATSDARGHFRIPHLGPVSGTLSVDSPFVHADRLEDVTPGGEPVRVVVMPPPTVEVRLVLPAGTAKAPPMWVVLQEGDRTRHCNSYTADDDGLYRIPLPEDTRVHVVLAPLGGIQVLRGPVSARRGETVRLRDVPLTEGRTLHGTVVDAEGRGVEGVRVTAAFPGLPERMMLLHARNGTTVTGGWFGISGVHEGPAVLRVHHKTFTARLVEVGDGEEEVRITVVPGAHVAGRVKGKQSPLRFSPVDVEGAEARLFFPDEQGRLSAGPLLPGRYRVTRAERGVAAAAQREIAVLVLMAGETRTVTWTVR